MLKLFLSPQFPRIYPSWYKFYSKAAENVKPIGSTDDLTLRRKTTNAVSSEKYVVDTASKLKTAEPLRSEVQSSKGQSDPSARNVDVKSRKGKKCGQPKPVVPKDQSPPRGPYIIDKCDIYDVPKGNSKKWKRISLLLLPIIAAFSALIFTGDREHPKHQYVPYEYLNIHNKRFPWGDGKLSLFHGPNNFIPDEESPSNK